MHYWLISHLSQKHPKMNLWFTTSSLTGNTITPSNFPQSFAWKACTDTQTDKDGRPLRWADFWQRKGKTISNSELLRDVKEFIWKSIIYSMLLDLCIAHGMSFWLWMLTFSAPKPGTSTGRKAEVRGLFDRLLYFAVKSIISNREERKQRNM